VVASWHKTYSRDAYPDSLDYAEDVVGALRGWIARLGEAGCKYIPPRRGPLSGCTSARATAPNRGSRRAATTTSPARSCAAPPAAERLITDGTQRQKLALIVKTAREIWG
jgi:hypothetical protein